MQPEAKAFRELLLWLFDQHRGFFTQPSSKIAEILDKIPVAYQGRFTERSLLERHLPNASLQSADFWSARQFLYLQPIEHSSPTVPVLTVKCDFGQPHPVVSMKLILFLLDGTHQLQMLGYRFESPHGQGEGRHDFYHVQAIRTLFRSPNSPALNCPQWLPDTHPSFALDAQDSVMLVLCLLISLYGLDYMMKNLITGGFGATMKKYFDLAHFMRFPPTFWRVKTRNKVFFQKTWYTQAKFKAWCLAEYGGKYTCERIAAAEYYAQFSQE
jgi:hypothetical protein